MKLYAHSSSAFADDPSHQHNSSKSSRPNTSKAMATRRAEQAHGAVAAAVDPLDLQQQNRNMKDAYQSNELGEVLLAVSKLQRACRCRARTQPAASTNSSSGADKTTLPALCSCNSHHKARSHLMISIAVFAMLASRVALLYDLPVRVADLISGILLAASAGTSYLALCYVLASCPATTDLGELLLDRASPFSWDREKPRFFFEVCSWMASVWYSYTTFHSRVLSICGGAVTAMGLAVISDFAAAYLRILEARVSRRDATVERVSWLKAVISYVCVGHLITQCGRILHAYFSEQDAVPSASHAAAIDDLVFNYMLITLVGVSLIVASELLMLYQPTRTIGLILQARIVDGRKNWEEHTWRSLLEITVTFGVTVLAYKASGEMVPSLQVGTFSGIVLILIGESLVAPSRRTRDGASRQLDMQQSALPADHWIKLAPVVVMMVFFCVQVYSAAVMMTTVNVPSETSTMFLGFIATSASALTIISLTDISAVASRFNKRAKVVIGKGCIVGTTLVACKLCHGLPGIAFSCYLSWFSLSFSRECWNDIQAKANARRARSRLKAPSLDDVDDDDATRPPLFSLSTTLLAYIKQHYPHLFKRTKWTFISMVIASAIDLCSTLFMLTTQQQASLDVTLSQFSAGNVVMSASFGYLTSSIQQELHPEVLVRTAVVRFKNKWLLFPLQSFIESTVFVGVFLGSFAATSTVFSSLTLAAMSGIVISFGGHWLCSRLQLNDRNSVRVRFTATCSLVFCLVLFSYTSMLALVWIYRYIDSLEATFCLASLAGVVFLAASEVFLLWAPTRQVGQILQERVTRAKENWTNEPLRSFLEIFTWFGVVYGSFALYNDLLLALQLGTFSGIAVTLSGEYFRRHRATLLPWGTSALATDDEDVLNSQATSDSSTDASSSSASATDAETKVHDRPRALPVMLLFAYIGSGTFQWIFENMRSLEMTVVVATIAGIAFLCVADLLVLYKPTRWAGVILQDRVIHVQRNWIRYPVRSFVEFGCFLGVIYGSYAIYGDFYVAVQVGTLSGTLVTLIGEQVRTHARARPVATGTSSSCHEQHCRPSAPPCSRETD